MKLNLLWKQSLLGCLVIVLLASCTTSAVETETPPPPTNTPVPPTNTPEPTATFAPTPLPEPISATEESEIDGIPISQVIFSIGQMDNSYDEFIARESLGFPEYECTVGIDCVTETFPILLTLSVEDWTEDYGVSYSEFAEGAVESIKIHFTLSQDYADLTLRVSRAGDETLIITLDEQEPISVTGEMLGSRDHWDPPGSYDVTLKSATKGDHTLLLTIHPTDGSGYPFFVWDALLLFTDAP